MKLRNFVLLSSRDLTLEDSSVAGEPQGEISVRVEESAYWSGEYQKRFGRSDDETDQEQVTELHLLSLPDMKQCSDPGDGGQREIRCSRCLWSLYS